jgi:hypothetical protein
MELERPFLEDQTLDPKKVRLDLSGDVHHYARYWGPSPAKAESNYASVVSGGGGAFLHGTSTDFGDVKAQATYPEKKDAFWETIGRVVNPLKIVSGGLLGLIGGLLGFVLVWALSVGPSTRDAGQRFFRWFGLELGAPAPELACIIPPSIESERFGALLHAELFFVVLLAGSFGLLFLAAQSMEDKWRVRFVGGGMIVFLSVAIFGREFFTAGSGLPHPFIRSFLLACGLALGVAFLAWNSSYRERLFEETRHSP